MLLLGAFISFSVVACSGDDDEETDNKSLLIGSWVWIYYSDNEPEFTDSCVIQFMTDGTFITHSYELVYDRIAHTRISEGTYEYSGGNTITSTVTSTSEDDEDIPYTSTDSIKFLDKNTFMIAGKDYDGGDYEHTLYRLGSRKSYRTSNARHIVLSPMLSAKYTKR